MPVTTSASSLSASSLLGAILAWGFLLIILSLMGLTAGCAKVFTPQRCETALRTADSVEAIVSILEGRGIPENKATIIASDIATGRRLIADVCAASNPPPVQPL